MKSKIGLFCSVRPECVIAAQDSKTIYEVPLVLHSEGLDAKVVERLGLETPKPNMSGWSKMVDTLKAPEREISIGIVGKYVDLKESYKSLHEAMVHGGIANNAKVNVVYIDSETLTDKNVGEALKSVDGVLVPGGFGERGSEGKISAIRYARENRVPFFGICFGMQMAAIEFARNVCGIKDATSREFVGDKKTARNCVIDIMVEQKNIRDMGGTMRLGSFPCKLAKGTRVHEAYGENLIHERHRHRYEFNNKYKALFEKKGLTMSGICEDRDLVEIIEISEHPWFVGVQFHPEFKSKPLAPHPLFKRFIGATWEYKKKVSDKAHSKRSSKALSKMARGQSSLL
jgi:CTP synthase